MSFVVKNVEWIRKIPNFGHRLAEALQSVGGAVDAVAQQTNSTPNGITVPPPPINGIKVFAGAGIHHVQIIDNNDIYRGIQYHFQYATDQNFTNPITVHMGPSRDWRGTLGTQPLFIKAYSDYPTTPHSNPVYFGGTTPKSIAATGTTEPPIPPNQGSGTGFPGQISGFGPYPFRTLTGKAPTR